MGRLAEETIGVTASHPDAYLGYLNDRCVTLAEALRPAGYRTYLAGKWHLGQRDESRSPLQRGFDRFPGILAGATSYLKPQGKRPLSLGNQILPPPTHADYYMTDAFTDFAIQTVAENKKGDPFFLYLAFNAPHWPLHARPEPEVGRRNVQRLREIGLRGTRHTICAGMGRSAREQSKFGVR